MAMKQDDKSKFKERLTCALCLEVYRSPKSFPCFHAYCTECIDKLNKYNKDDILGYYCPLCRGFAAVSDVQSSFFLTDLIELSKELDENNHKFCEQCEIQVSEWKCIDCKIVLCPKCQIFHLKIPVCKGHRTIPLDEETPLILDKLVFCKKHEDEIIKFHCKTCLSPICIKCKVLDHDTHHAETIEAAVQNIIYKVNLYIVKLKRNISLKAKEKANILVTKTDIETKFSSVKQKVQATEKSVMTQIKQDTEKCLKDLDIKKKNELDSIKQAMQNVENKITEYEGMSQWANTILDNANGETLIHEYYAGIHKKWQKISISHDVQLHGWEWQNPSFVPEDLAKVSLIGSVEYKEINSTKKQNETKPSYIGIDTAVGVKAFSIAQFFEKCPTIAKTIKVSGIKHRFSFIDGKLWIPLTNQIKVLSMDGSSKEIISTAGKNPTALADECPGNVIVAFTTELSVFKVADKKWHSIHKGNFSDVTSEYGYTAAARINTFDVLLFKNSNVSKNQYDIITKINWKGQLARINMKNEIIYLHFNKQRIIKEYNFKGEKVYSYSTATNDYQPNEAAKLCYIDSNGSMLFCDWYNSLIEMHVKGKIHVVQDKMNKFMVHQNDIAVQDQEKCLVLAGQYIHLLIPYKS